MNLLVSIELLQNGQISIHVHEDLFYLLGYPFFRVFVTQQTMGNTIIFLNVANDVIKMLLNIIYGHY